MRFISAKLLYHSIKRGILHRVEVVTMINRPLYIDKIMAYVDTPFVKILTGVRRCGKSTILKMLMEKLRKERNVEESRIVSYRFDSLEYEDMIAKQMFEQIKSKVSENEKIT